jgi:peroxiredoxin
MTLLRLTLLLGMVCLPLYAHADLVEHDLTVPSGASIPVHVAAAAKSRTTLLWIPSEHGLRTGMEQAATGIAKQGFTTWLADLQTGYFVPADRDSVKAYKTGDILALMQDALDAGAKRLLLISAGRGARATLEAAHAWQVKHPDQAGALQGVILLHPYLYVHRPAPGTEVAYVPATYATNLPVFLIQPENSSRYWRLSSLQASLRQGGAAVYTKVIPGIEDGFISRPDGMLTAGDRQARKDFPTVIHQAAFLLEHTPRSAHPPQLRPMVRPTGEQQAHADDLNTAGQPAPPLKLKDLQGQPVDLAALRGKVVLVSFWAKWCPPCREELPTLINLYQQLSGENFTIVSVEVGGKADVVRDFVDQEGINFPVLHDTDGHAVRTWSVYAYPTNFLIGPDGRIRYAHFGARDWNSPASMAMIRKLMP